MIITKKWIHWNHVANKCKFLRVCNQQKDTFPKLTKRYLQKAFEQHFNHWMSLHSMRLHLNQGKCCVKMKNWLKKLADSLNSGDKCENSMSEKLYERNSMSLIACKKRYLKTTVSRKIYEALEYKHNSFPDERQPNGFRIRIWAPYTTAKGPKP